MLSIDHIFKFEIEGIILTSFLGYIELNMQSIEYLLKFEMEELTNTLGNTKLIE